MTKEELEKEAKEWCKKKNLTPSNVGYFTADYCEQSYIAGAEPREKRIAELEDKLANADYQLEGRDNEIRELKEKLEKETAQRVYNFNKSIEWKEKHRELEAQIEKMKNCKNCANYMISGKCPCFFRTGWCKNWEMTRSK